MRRLLLAGVLLAAVVGAPLEAQKYIAFGDSIMVGNSWPCFSGGVCPIVFDCSGACAVSNSQAIRDECSLSRRLNLSLGGTAYVQNRGWAGETTTEAVVRFPTEMSDYCGTPGECNAVLLMHGTNDMTDPISLESQRDNLAIMIGQAKAQGIDTVLMSIIRDYDELDPDWQAYRDLVAALAVDEELEFVDTHAALCPDEPCRNANYFLPGASPCSYPDLLGTAHIDPEGYDVLAGLVEAKFPPSLPLMPGPLTPSGDIADAAPNFVWAETATARWYELEVDGASTWWEAAAHCMAGTCTVDPGLDLVQGAHSWRVRGRNLRGLGAWSAATAFTIWGVPGTPTPSAPSGLYFEPSPMSAPFAWEPYEWSEEADATHYDLEVSGGGPPVYQQSFDASVCAPTCSVSPEQALAGGSYTWTVAARNPAVTGPASAPLAFEVRDTPPEEATPTGPTGEHFEPLAPLYEWLPAPYATEYDLEVRDAGGNLDAGATGLLASVVCGAGQCSHQGGTLSDPDDYTLKVRGRNPVGDGDLSSTGAEFTVLACADPSPQELEDLEPGPVIGPAEVSHCGPVAAATMAPYTIEATGSLTVHTRDGFSAFDGFSVLGELTVRSP